MLTFLTKLRLGEYNRKHLGILFVVGLLLVVIAMPTSGTIEESSEVVTTEETIGSEMSDLEYKEQMEEQLEEMLSLVEGVGEVKVMITLETSTQKMVEKDVYSNAEEMEEETVYTEGIYGEVPYVYTEVYPTIEGVVVAAEGGDSAIVIQNITEGIQALFDVDTHKIKIMKMKTSE